MNKNNIIKDIRSFLKQSKFGECFDSQNSLENLIDFSAFEYLIIYAVTDELLQQYHDDINKEFTFPIDYFEFAEWLGIEIYVDKLNHSNNDDFGKTIGKLALNHDGKYCIILEYTETPYNMRYAICHEIAHFLCDDINTNCVWAQLPNSKNEIISDIVASFLLLPPKKTFEFAYKYAKNNDKRPVDLEELFKYLSVLMCIPNYRVITSYEHLKILACYLYNNTYASELGSKLNHSLSNKIIVERIKTILGDGSIAHREFFA